MANVLIVDDSAIMRVNLRSMLTRAGHVVVGEAGNAEKAYYDYKRFNPDIVTMDINMPGTDGIEATKKILKENSKAKVIIVSSIEKRDLVVDALEAGAKQYILKPITYEKLLGRINKVLNGEEEKEEIEEIDVKIVKENKQYFCIKNDKGVFYINFNPDFNLEGLKFLKIAISGLLFVDPLDVVFDFGEIEALDINIYNSIVEITKELFEAKAAVKVLINTKPLAKFVMHNSINAYAKVCTNIEGEEEEEEKIE